MGRRLLLDRIERRRRLRQLREDIKNGAAEAITFPELEPMARENLALWLETYYPPAPNDLDMPEKDRRDMMIQRAVAETIMRQMGVVY